MSPQVSARALDVVENLAARWGEDLGNGITRIRRSQTTMARDLGCSAGTIAWYLSHAGNTVRRQGNDILVERTATPTIPPPPRRSSNDGIAAALIEHFGHPTDTDLIELLDDNDRPPTTRTMAAALSRHHSTIHSHLTRLEEQGQLTRIGRRILLSHERPSPTARPAPHRSRAPKTVAGSAVVGPDPTVLATLSHAVSVLAETAHILSQLAALDRETPRSVGRQAAETRDPSADTAADDENEVVVDVHNPNPGETPTANCLTNQQARPRQPANLATAPTGPGQLPTGTAEDTDRPGADDEVLDNVLAPLLTACDRYRLPAMIDRHGRDILRQQDPAALEAAVAETTRLARAGNLKSPLGFLVSRAKEDPTWFAQALRSRRRAESRSRTQPGMEEQQASDKTSETQSAEARWVAEVLNRAQLAHMVTQYRSRHPKRKDPLIAAMAPLITQAARDAIAAHPDLDPATAVAEFAPALFDIRLEDGKTAAIHLQIPLSTTGPQLATVLRELDK